MENNTSALKNSAGLGMYEFFHEEFQSLRAKTGIRQWEQLNEQPNAAKVIHDHIEFMCQECNKAPFHLVRQDIKQRVISRAIVETDDFIGLNAKFVRKALNAWWVANGDRVMETINQKDNSVYERVKLTPEQSRKIDKMASAYVAQLLQGDGLKAVPPISKEEAEKKGGEWISNIERKAIQYPLTSESEAKNHELHLEWARRNFDVKTGDKLPTWKPEREWIDGLTDSEKQRVYKQAGLTN